jgi:CRP/FNR family cyclic AMP-dependent transcriptional regulator
VSKIWENIFKQPLNEIKGIETTLTQIPIFQDLKPRELAVIKRIIYHRDYERNEVIFRQDAVGLGMYIIVKGTVSITIGPENQELVELKDGDFFGELALLDDSPRSANAIAKTPSHLLCFFKPELLDLLQRSPRLGNKVLLKLAWTIGERLKSTNDRLDEICSFSKRQNASGE